MSLQPKLRIITMGTGGLLSDRFNAAWIAEQYLPKTALQERTTVLLDLNGIDATPGALQNLILPIAQQIRDGICGPAKLVIATSDPAIASYVGFLAKAHSLPIFTVSSAGALQDARPAGQLTPTEEETLSALLEFKGEASSPHIAERFDIELTAATNRLVNLEKKGYLFRIAKGGREADVFIDPRVTAPSQSRQ